MRRLIVMCAALALTVAVPAFAQQDAAAPRPAGVEEQEALERARAQEREKEERARAAQQEKEKEKPRQEKAEQQAGVTPAAPGLKGQALNVRLELTIRDQRGSQQPVTKTVSMVVADRSMGRIRTQSTVLTERHGAQPVLVNVDGRPVVLSDGRVLLQLTLEYRPADAPTTRSEGASPSPATPSAQAPPHVSESIEMIVQSGKPIVVSRSADPDSDRSVTVEVNATVIK
jgi:hypothetical protein